ncbi:hypothetical protein CEUSTIGMA_g8276.t1 [Chlamydomonas eustigma]|uniref:MD-2-related lipid-recognition domain-containing protein n=1 Tax=Chlamydomonas eustigma TaxID=1157962 RepID=A0A250XCN7_9CHLO|nr:hypothetical protein CEUSTIGMA_g8276.t1 [Chlamydomonas eustigma]|eukprot:GAX80841.1 hypothetical protein CEUSTIGMA_g8276.t1 [Chlamydomonas eustigma]
MTWQPCDDTARKVSPTEVSLTPDPPVIGGSAQFDIIANSEEDIIKSGTVDITISFAGVDIFSKSDDLCDKAACPILKGPTKVTLVELLPPIAPPGDYGLKLVAKGSDSSELLCLLVNFELVMPEGGEAVDALRVTVSGKEGFSTSA